MVSTISEWIQRWLTSYLGDRRRGNPGPIDVQERFIRIGLDSLGATKLAADLGAELGRAVSPTWIWEFPTIEALAHYLTEGAGDRGAVTSRSRTEGYEPIAVIGMACRFPRSQSPDAFWRLLREGLDAITDVPSDRWDPDAFYDPDPAAQGKMNVRRAGFLDQVDQFDPLFFGISPREAAQMDPQQRLMLELSWEALEDAGVPPHSLRGSLTGVFYGVLWNDYAKLSAGDLDAVVQHTATGQDSSIVTARVSYTLGLQGPSVSVNTACSSSLVAVHLACEALRSGDAALALAGGGSLIIAPDTMVALSKFGGLSADGRSKAFDARADGYGRGEGGGVLVLKPLRKAIADGDPIHAVIRATVVNNDGFSNGLTAPNPRAQEQLLREAYRRAGVPVDRVHYVEAHGTGTALGDPIEARALAAVLCDGRAPERPLRIGSVKTNIGHLEGAAGIAGLIKTILTVKHRQIPPSLQFEQPNPHIPFDELHLRVPQALEPWPDDEPALCGVSSFGWGGTNAHAVVEGWPPAQPACVLLSAESVASLQESARAIVASAEHKTLPELVAEARARSCGEAHRLAATAWTARELADKLTGFVEGTPAPGLSYGPATSVAGLDAASHAGAAESPPRRRLVFVCSPQGSQWIGMGRQLMSSEPVFRAALERFDRALARHTGWSLMDGLCADESAARFDDVEFVQPAIIGVQIALAEQWRAWGVVPDAVVGLCIGEVSAAHIAGVLDLEDAALVIYQMSRLQGRLSRQGGMAVIGVAAETLLRPLARHAGRLCIAGYNTEGSTVVSGDPAALDDLIHTMKGEGVTCGRVRINVAVHSAQMDTIAPEIAEALRSVRPARATIRLVSTTMARWLNGPEVDGTYFARCLRRPMLFTQATELLLEEGYDTFVELSPSPALLYALQDNAQRAGTPIETLPSLSKGEDERVTLLDTRGALYVIGIPARIEDVPAPDGGSREQELFLLSARSGEALRDRARQMAEWVTERSDLGLRDLCYTSSVCRSHLEHRLATVVGSRRDLSEALAAFAQGDDGANVISGEAAPGSAPRLAFVFSGQGSQSVGMGRELIAEEPAFRSAVEACDSLVRLHGGFSLLDELAAPETTSRLADTAVAQPALFAIQVGLAALWRSWGVLPDAVVGQSIGELAAAHIAGVLSLNDAIRIVCLRGRIVKKAVGKGRMATVELSSDEVASALSDYQGRVAIASINSPASVVLAGETAALEEVVARLSEQGVYCRWLAVNYASHSPQMEPLRGEIERAIGAIELGREEVPLYSTVTGAKLEDAALDARYWAENLCATVRLAPAIDALVASGVQLFMDISPHPVLLGSLERCLATHEGCHAIPSLRRGQAERRCILQCAGALHVYGRRMAWEHLYPLGGRAVALPAYPWQRQRYWIEDSGRSEATARQLRMARGGSRGPTLLGASLTSSVQPGTVFWEQPLGADTLPWVADHRVQGEPVLPGAAYVDMALSAASQVGGEALPTLERVDFERMLFAPAGGVRDVQAVLHDVSHGEASFEVSSRASGEQDWLRHAKAQLRWGSSDQGTEGSGETPEAIAGRCPATMTSEDHYRVMARIGLDYGGYFRSVVDLWLGPGEVLGHVRSPEQANEKGGRYEFHPALLDGCFQALVALFASERGAREGGPTVVPVGFDRLRINRRPGRELWVHGRRSCIDGGGAESNAFDVRLLENDGQVVAEIHGLRLTELAAPTTAVQIPGAEWLYALEWRRRDVEEEATVERPEPSKGAFLVLMDQGGTGAELAKRLDSRGDACVRCVVGGQFARVEPCLYTVDPSDPTSYRNLLRDAFSYENPCRGVVHLWSLDATAASETTSETLDDDQRLGSVSALLLSQALLREGRRDPPRLWLVTRGAVATGAETGPLSVSQAPLWGLGRTLALEHPELECARVDLGLEAAPHEEGELLLRELDSTDGEDQVALRPAGRYVARLARTSFDAAPEASPAPEPAGDRPFSLQIPVPGALDRMILRHSARRVPGPGEVEIEVEHAGLNFRDVLLALGAIPDEGADPEAGVRLGMECSGRVVAVGEGVTHLCPGDVVFALGASCFSSFVTTPSTWAARVPVGLRLEQAASIPIAFMTAYHALAITGGLRAGERVLIHAGAGGVGMAAIQVAQHLGAEIFATAGSEEKRDLLRSLGVPHVMDSRTIRFADDVMRITGGEGVDVVLNSLSGPLLGASLGLLRDYGRFVEIGKRDYYEDRRLALRPFLKSLSFSLFDLHGMMRSRPDLIASLFEAVAALFSSGALRPTPCRVFPVSAMAEAFDTMARARHVGKLVVAMRDPAVPIAPPIRAGGAAMRDDGTYLITGGLGGLGLSLSRWMVAEGARHVALMGRSGASAEAEAAIAAMRAAGAEVRILRADVSRTDAVAAAIAEMKREMPLLCGVVHAAAVLDDRTVLETSPERLRKVMAPKMLGAWNLHTLTQNESLDFFIMYSSALSILGSPGQAGYVAANAALDALARHRHALGLPAMSVQWGPFSDVGLAAAQDNRGARLAGRGLRSLSPADGEAVLKRLLERPRPEVGVLSLELRQWLEFYPGAAGSPYWSELLSEDGAQAKAASAPSLRGALGRARPRDRAALLEKELRALLGRVLGLPAQRIDRLAGFTSLGMDSLMSLELKNRLEASLDVKLSASLLFMYPNLKSLTQHMIDDLGLAPEPAEAPHAGPGAAATVMDPLPEDELMTLFDGPAE